jgi:hypothetical protein
MRRSLKVGAATLIGMAVLTAACAGSGASTPSETKLVTSFDVTPQDGVAVLDESDVEELLASADPAAGEYRFRGTPDGLESLEIGQTVVIPGAGFGIVEAVTQEGDETVVRVGEATLGDVIESGTLEWDYDVSWTDFEFSVEELTGLAGVTNVEISPVGAGLEVVSGASPGPHGFGSATRFRLIEAQAGQRKTTISFKQGGWEFTLDLEPKGDKLEFKLKGTFGGGKTAEVKMAAISGKGWVSGFNYTSVAEFEGGVMTDMTTEFSGLQGEMELTWAAFRTPQRTLSDVVRFQVPLSVPIPVPGPLGIPFTLKLKMVGRIVPELSAPGSSSGGSWKVTYNSDQGFNVTETGAKPTGSLKSSNIGTSGDTVTAGQGPAGFGLGLEFPRFELGIKGLKDPFAFITLDMYSTSLWTPGTTLTADIPPCQYGYTKFSAVAAYQLKVMGLGITDQYTIWEKQIDVYLDGKECTLTGD